MGHGRGRPGVNEEKFQQWVVLWGILFIDIKSIVLSIVSIVWVPNKAYKLPRLYYFCFQTSIRFPQFYTFGYILLCPNLFFKFRVFGGKGEVAGVRVTLLYKVVHTKITGNYQLGAAIMETDKKYDKYAVCVTIYIMFQ